MDDVSLQHAVAREANANPPMLEPKEGGRSRFLETHLVSHRLWPSGGCGSFRRAVSVELGSLGAEDLPPVNHVSFS